MLKAILAAYRSESLTKAYQFALDLTKRYEAKLIVLSVARPRESPEDIKTEAMLESAKERYETQLVSIQAEATTQGVTARFEVVVGRPAEQIVHHAEQEACDRIVTGYRGSVF